MNDAVTLKNRLQIALGRGAVVTEASDLAGHLEDWRGRYRGDALCMVLPKTADEVSAVVKLCAEHRVPVLPQGGNTSLCGGAVPATDGPAPVIVNLARMCRIRDIDATNGSMVVEAGCVLQTIQEAAAGQGRLYPVSLGAEGSCQIGGTLATNAGGTSVVRYGNTRENVLGLEVVLADGTLGIITAAVLKLHPLPTHHALAWFAATDPAAALRILGLFQSACGSRLSAFEMMNRLQLDLVLEHMPNRRKPLNGAHDWHVLVELADTRDPDALEALLTETLGAAVEYGLVEDAIVAANDTQRKDLWEVRHSVSEANKKTTVGITTDCAVPVSAVPAFIDEATRAVHEVVPGLGIVIVGHLGDGNVHFIPMFPLDAWRALPDPAAMAAAMRRRVNDVASRLGGSFSAEHGVGQTGRDEMRRYKSAEELALMRMLKQALDPAGLMNPGRLLP